MTTTTTKRRVLVLLLALFLALAFGTFFIGFTDTAEGTIDQGTCQTFYDHSGSIPGSYDYAEFYEDGQLVTTVQTNGVDISVNPADYGAGSAWDQVNKCQDTDTTTTPTTTPSTTTPTTTPTTAPPTTSTTQPTTTTTQPTTTITETPPTTSFSTFLPQVRCVGLDVIVSATFNPAEFYRVDVHIGLQDSSPDGIFLQSGEEINFGQFQPGTAFTFVGYRLTGVITTQMIFSGVCEDTSPGSSTPTTAAPTTDSTLPFTGIERGGLRNLLASGFVFLVLGFVGLMEAPKWKGIRE